ncbi:MAG TPA: hypothetical protein VFQ91_15015 [Bryobacteraceae bacterium]|nr:hypothetical protein [Bryobacteraceae bacterium]
MRIARRFVVSLLWSSFLLSGQYPVPQQLPQPQQAPPPNTPPAGLSPAYLQQEAKLSYGVVISKPKVYDDALLRDMLATASARLAAISAALDAAKINAAFGAISGATLSSSGFGVSIQGPGAPSVATTAKGPTQSAENSTTVADTLASQYPGRNTTTVDRMTRGDATTDVVTQRAAINPPAITAPASSLSLPSSMGPSSSDILNEQVQLMAEIANLRLLLDGALSDQIMRISANQQLIRKRITIGIPVTLSPAPLSKDRVTIVEVLAWSPAAQRITPYDPEPRGLVPAITALLPKDKTYNVASITDRNLSLSGGAVLGVVGAGAAYTRSRKTWFVVAAQDTVALNLGQTADNEPPTIRFAWQLRPVLRQKFLRAGTRELMVQLAPPTFADVRFPVSLRVRTYLRKYNQTSGLVGDVIEQSVTDWSQYDVPAQDLQQFPNDVSLEDLGDGNVLVNIQQRFLNGTYIRVGNRKIVEGNGMTLEAERLRFVASRLELANRNVRVVSRDGSETRTAINTKCSFPKNIKATTEANGDTSIRVRVNFGLASASVEKDVLQDPEALVHVIVAGENAYRAEWDPASRSSWADIPIDILKAQPAVRLQALLRANCRADLTLKVPEKQKLSLTVISRGTNSATFVLTGDASDTATLAPLPGLAGVQLTREGNQTVLSVLTPTAVASLQSVIVLIDGKSKLVAVPQPSKPDPPACCFLKPAA